MPLNRLMEQYQRRVGEKLEAWLPDADIGPTRLHQAMRYAVLGGGKRIRPLLVYFSGEVLAAPLEWLDNPACAVECIHAYSLVHDDLPAMDDDYLRRGQPTCHNAFDEATALLAGDALQTLAFQILAREAGKAGPPMERQVEMIHVLALAAGSRGMAGGQALDMEAVGQTLNVAELENMHIHKTGALIRACVKLGALCAPEVTPDQLEALDHYAKCIGLAFQIQDDVLDVESETEVLGKKQGGDSERGKPTYPSLLGLPGAKKMAGELVDEALASLEGFDKKADPLRWTASYIVTRRS